MNDHPNPIPIGDGEAIITKGLGLGHGVKTKYYGYEWMKGQTHPLLNFTAQCFFDFKKPSKFVTKR